MNVDQINISVENGRELVEVLTQVINVSNAKLREHVTSEIRGLKQSQDELKEEFQDHLRRCLPRTPRKGAAK